jgi:hypothetical protein
MDHIYPSNMIDQIFNQSRYISISESNQKRFIQEIC